MAELTPPVAPEVAPPLESPTVVTAKPQHEPGHLPPSRRKSHWRFALLAATIVVFAIKLWVTG